MNLTSTGHPCGSVSQDSSFVAHIVFPCAFVVSFAGVAVRCAERIRIPDLFQIQVFLFLLSHACRKYGYASTTCSIFVRGVSFPAYPRSIRLDLAQVVCVQGG